jgi:thiol:disulfide interchange protein
VLAQVGDHWTLTIPLAEDKPKAEALQGILQTNDGWLEGGKTNAFEVKLPLGAVGSGAAGAPTNSAAPAGGEEYGTLTLLFFAFIGGLILNVMPCVFPVIGIKIMGFVQQAGEDKKKIVMHGLAYTAGVLVCFWALALFVIIAGKGWGSQLQSPLFVFGLCYFFLAFGLNMAGVFEFGTSVMGVGQDLQSKSGLGGSFFQGLLATVVATPCSAPFLAPALAWAVSLPPFLALAVFTVIGLGLALPYLVLSFAPGLVKLMPRPGAWMESFKQGMSFLLFGTAGYMLWVLTGMVEQWNVLMTILGLVLLALACWIYGRWFLPHKSARARSIGLVATALALAGGLWLGWPTDLKPTSAEAAAADGSHLNWQVWSPELVKELRAANKPVYIDFTALWCATCQFNKRQYKNDAIKAMIKDKQVQLLKADYTNYDERIIKVLREEYHREAVPVNVLYLPGSAQAIILPSALTEGNLTEAFQQIK